MMMVVFMMPGEGDWGSEYNRGSNALPGWRAGLKVQDLGFRTLLIRIRGAFHHKHSAVSALIWSGV